MNSIVSIGYLGIQKCYLNISESDAIDRYCKSENLTLEEFNESGVRVLEFKFDDEFGCYDIWK